MKKNPKKAQKSKKKLSKAPRKNLKTLFDAAVQKDETLKMLFTPTTDEEGKLTEHPALVSVRAKAKKELL